MEMEVFASHLDISSQCAQMTMSEIITFIDIAQDWGISWHNLRVKITSFTADTYVRVAVSVGILVRLWVTTLQWNYVSRTWSAHVLVIWVCLRCTWSGMWWCVVWHLVRNILKDRSPFETLQSDHPVTTSHPINVYLQQLAVRTVKFAWIYVPCPFVSVVATSKITFCVFGECLAIAISIEQWEYWVPLSRISSFW
jgi:hypothetical protein